MNMNCFSVFTRNGFNDLWRNRECECIFMTVVKTYPVLKKTCVSASFTYVFHSMEHKMCRSFLSHVIRSSTSQLIIQAQFTESFQATFSQLISPLNGLDFLIILVLLAFLFSSSIYVLFYRL